MRGLIALHFVLLLAVLAVPSPSTAADYILQRVTNNTVDDEEPRVSGSNIVWTSADAETPGESDQEIFFWNGSTITQVTHNTFEDYHPRILGSRVVWEATSPTDLLDTNIYYWGGAGVVPLATSSASEYDPDVFPSSGGFTVVWHQDSGVNLKLFFWDGVSTTSVSPGIDGYGFSVSGSNYAWYAVDQETPGESDMEIFYSDGNTITQVTHNTIEDYDPIISGTNIAWWGTNDTGDDIYYWTGSGEPFRLTDERVFVWDFSLDGSNLAWSASVSSAPADIFLTDMPAKLTYRITNDLAENYTPHASGSTVVWSRKNVGEADTEIYMTNVSEPSATLATSSVLLTLLFLSGYRTLRARH